MAEHMGEGDALDHQASYNALFTLQHRLQELTEENTLLLLNNSSLHKRVKEAEARVAELETTVKHLHGVQDERDALAQQVEILKQTATSLATREGALERLGWRLVVVEDEERARQEQVSLLKESLRILSEDVERKDDLLREYARKESNSVRHTAVRLVSDGIENHSSNDSKEEEEENEEEEGEEGEEDFVTVEERDALVARISQLEAELEACQVLYDEAAGELEAAQREHEQFHSRRTDASDGGWFTAREMCAGLAALRTGNPIRAPVARVLHAVLLSVEQMGRQDHCTSWITGAQALRGRGEECSTSQSNDSSLSGRIRHLEACLRARDAILAALRCRLVAPPTTNGDKDAVVVFDIQVWGERFRGRADGSGCIVCRPVVEHEDAWPHEHQTTVSSRQDRITNGAGSPRSHRTIVDGLARLGHGVTGLAHPRHRKKGSDPGS